MDEHTAWCLVSAILGSLYLVALVVAGLMTAK
jgi:hypothetical protein